MYKCYVFYPVGLGGGEMMKKFNKPYLEVINLNSKDSIKSTCVIECTCDIEACTCEVVCGCDDDCVVFIDPSH